MLRNRLPFFMAYVGMNGGGQTVEGIPPLLLANTLPKPLIELTAFGKTEKVGNTLVCNNGTLTLSGGALQAVGTTEKLGINGTNIFNYKQTRPISFNAWSTRNKFPSIFCGINVYGGSWDTEGSRLDSTSANFNSSARAVCVPAKKGDVIRIKFFGSLPENPRYRVAECDDEFVTEGKASYSLSNKSYTYTVKNINSKYAVLQWATAAGDEDAGIVVTKNEPLPTSYEAFKTAFQPESVMLNGLETFIDTYNVISGEIVRNVGIKVFDGTEAISRYVQSSTGNEAYIYFGATDRMAGKQPMLSSHYEYSSANGWQYLPLGCFGTNSNTDTAVGIAFIEPAGSYATAALFKEYLAQQYANGTPVIVAYPLAEPTMETTTPQTFTFEGGNYTATIQEASLDGLSLRVKYKSQ